MSNRILLDTSSYLRLAFTIDPLLRKPFGRYDDELFVLPELDKEFQRNPRLRNDFPWVTEAHYVQNRKKGRLTILDPQKGDVNRALEIMMRTAEIAGNAVSPIDTKCLACGYVLKIHVVSDDSEMLSLAEEFQVQTLTSLGLLKRMLDESYQTPKQIEDIVKYWIYADDLPANWRNQYEEFFQRKPPMEL
jgi:hypothetical protein